MGFDISDVFYSQYFHQHISAVIPVIFKGDVLITRIQLWLIVSPSLHSN